VDGAGAGSEVFGPGADCEGAGAMAPGVDGTFSDVVGAGALCLVFLSPGRR